jgi:hypothetical protein
MAQAYRRKGDLQRALDLYKNYLIENPDSPKRSEIEKRIRALEKEMKNPARRQIEAPAPVAQPSEPPPAAPAVVVPAPPFGGFGTDSPPNLPGRGSPAPVATPAPPAEIAQPAPLPSVPAAVEPATPTPSAAPAVAPVASLTEAAPPVPAPETTSSGRGLRVAGIVCGAAGVASIGTAVYFYTRATSLSDRISGSDAPTSSDYQAGKDAETMQWVFYGVGAAALATGAILYWLGSSSSASAPTATVVAPIVGPGIAGLSAQGTF